MDRPLPDVSVSNAVDATYLRPMGRRRFLFGQGFPKDYADVDPYNYRETADETFVELMLARATRRFPPLEGMTLLTAYAALYDVTPDWYPFIGPRAGLAGYYDACGGSGPQSSGSSSATDATISLRSGPSALASSGHGRRARGNDAAVDGRTGGIRCI